MKKKQVESQNLRPMDELEIHETVEQTVQFLEREMEDHEPEDQLEIPIQSGSEAGLPAHRELTAEEMDFYRGLIEAILFASPEPVSVTALARQCSLDRTNTRILVDSLVDDYSERGGGIILREVAGGYRFLTSEAYSGLLSGIFADRRPERLSRSVLETLAIVAYRQPITLPEIEEIRGVNSRAMIATLLQKKLVKPQGYRPVPGRPTLYVTTRQFLLRFHLNTLADLPPLRDLKELPFGDTDRIDDISLD
jgi:segregation and condensation protein B